MSEKDKPRTHFDRLKACETPEDMVLALNADERRFCPRGYERKPELCEEACGKCIADWLREEVRPHFTEEEVAAAHMFLDAYPGGRLEREDGGDLYFFFAGRCDLLPRLLFPSLRPGRFIALKEIIGG